MALHSLSVARTCAVLRAVCLRNLPQVPSPVPGGRVSSARSCVAAHCVFGNVGLCSHLSAQEGSWWFGLSWMLAGFVYSRHGITTAKRHHCSGSGDDGSQADGTHKGAPWLR